MTVAAFDVSDPQWQVTEEHKPDKESTWKHSLEQDGWVHAHNSLRGEIQDLTNAFGSIMQKFPEGAPRWAVESVKKVWSAHHSHVKSHHANEEDIMVPFMETRCRMPPRIMESQHLAISDSIYNVTNAVNKLEVGASLIYVHAAFQGYTHVILPHLEEEEKISLPLLRAYFTPKEAKTPTLKIFVKGIPIEKGSFVHYMSEEKFREGFMKQEAIPYLIWLVVFKPKYQHYLKHVICHIDALKAGEEALGAGCFRFL